jgi:uncharacterized FlaG/YvyC family protein
MQLVTWIVCSAAVIVIVRNALGLWRDMSGGFAQREIPPKEYVALSACSAQHKRHNEEIESIRAEAHQRIEAVYAEIRTLRAQTKDDIENVHSRINEVLKGVSRIEGKLSGTHGRRSYDT